VRATSVSIRPGKVGSAKVPLLDASGRITRRIRVWNRHHGIPIVIEQGRRRGSPPPTGGAAALCDIATTDLRTTSGHWS